MEFVRVLFPSSRKVRIDGKLNGTTNKNLQVNAGTHRFALDGPADFSPPSIDQAVTGTTNSFPLTIQFVPLAIAMAAPETETAGLDAIAPEAPVSRKRAAKRRRPAAKKKKAPAKKPARKAPAKKKPAKKTARKRSKKTSKKARK
jgi:hypothetical protein